MSESKTLAPDTATILADFVYTTLEGSAQRKERAQRALAALVEANRNLSALVSDLRLQHENERDALEGRIAALVASGERLTNALSAADARNEALVAENAQVANLQEQRDKWEELARERKAQVAALREALQRAQQYMPRLDGKSHDYDLLAATAPKERSP